MDFTDRILKCIECGTDFIFTAGEQVFFHDKQFKNDPKHCKQCKAKRNRGSPRVRPETRTRCSACGADTTVPFKPTQGRPVLCRSCFQKMPKPPVTPLTEPIPAPLLVAESEPASSMLADVSAPAVLAEAVPVTLLGESVPAPVPTMMAEAEAGSTRMPEPATGQN